MVVKSVSSRASIIGRGAKCRGKSAVEQSGYITRTIMYSEYYGETYFPKSAEDLVSTGVLLPDHAPREYLDHSVLWNSVEKVEKHAKAQLCRLNKYSLPNWMSYELADKFVQDFIKRNFVSKGMCAEYAIHDSVNEKGERNLHVHILLTMRPILENGEWGEKSRKVYKYDKDGNKIKKKNGRYDCTTEKTTDWDDKGNARKWRQDLVESINKVAEEIGIEDERWEWRSFKERGLDIKPTIHLGEKATALERKGIHTDKGDYNREVAILNSLIVKAFEYAKAQIDKPVSDVKKAVTTIAVKVKNELLDLIREIAERNHNRLKVPIVGKEYFSRIKDNGRILDRDYLETFVKTEGISTFDELKEFKAKREKECEELTTKRHNTSDRMEYLKRLLDEYGKYEPYIKFNKEQYSLKRWARKKYEREHIAELAYYDSYRSKIKNMIKEPDKKITPKAWKKELDALTKTYDETKLPYSKTISNLACCEVLSYNRRELQRMFDNENRQLSRTSQQIPTKKKKEQSL